jgi:hypothetical protein
VANLEYSFPKNFIWRSQKPFSFVISGEILKKKNKMSFELSKFINKGS